MSFENSELHFSHHRNSNTCLHKSRPTLIMMTGSYYLGGGGGWGRSWHQSRWCIFISGAEIQWSQYILFCSTSDSINCLSVAALSLCSCSRFEKTLLSREIEQYIKRMYTPLIHAHVYPYCLASTFCFETWTRFWLKLLFWATLSGMFLHWGIPSDRAFIALHEILFHLLIWRNLFRKGVQPPACE